VTRAMESVRTSQNNQQSAEENRLPHQIVVVKSQQCSPPIYCSVKRNRVRSWWLSTACIEVHVSTTPITWIEALRQSL